MGISTEDRIKVAARRVFYKKGYAAARTVDLAREADVSTAMLNYYFRSKSRLFEVVMMESLSYFVMGLEEILNDQSTDLAYKLELLALQCIDRMIEDPELPLFILSEMRNNHSELIGKLQISGILKDSVFLCQLNQAGTQGKLRGTAPLHLVTNIMGLIFFPFIAKPLVSGSHGIDEMEFDIMVRERRTLIPFWIAMMIE
ncbi:TetR/AcrR family transcriptional regulator [Flavobacterium pectinovorum]|uniref:TetR family transcriptional regulator n=1 Tax=Flavobacterium pectinovorum TaxID=29533 RepID=A0AB36P769_9FLAO|nr:TetR/AcrR family transcriptional regulator [Flavobacterium pectinovorum]OXB07758.1 TetR family transcriptional regulator [Flavobacterium pectinovorum]SHM79551.1 transcriptional regulator, TetR family [Flavobacterium pectinovorum]